MKKSTIQKTFTGIYFLLFTISLFSQSTDFQYKEKGKNHYEATIYFSNAEGTDDVAPKDFSEHETIFFTVTTNSGSEKEYFKDSDIQDWFSDIRLVQSGKEIPTAKTPKPIKNTDDKIVRVVLSFPKKNLKLFEPLAFANAIDTSDAINIADKYFPKFNRYLPIYEESMELSDQLQYIDTYKKVITIVEDAKTNEEIKHYSFYDHAANTLATNAIEQHIDSLSKLMIAENLHFQHEVSEQALNNIDSVYAMMETAKRIFSPYFAMEEPKSKICLEKCNSMLENATAIKDASHKTYKGKILSFLETGNYSNYKFRLFMEIIAKMTTRLDTLKILDGIDELNIAMLDDMPEIKKELMMTNWTDDFQRVVKMLNHDIRTNKKIFNGKIIENLQRLKPDEHQPYLLIFLAFNELSTNKSLFLSYLTDALTYCTDQELILNMEMWILSNNLTLENLAKSTVHQINKGILMVKSHSWIEAETTFSTITRQANTIAPPWFYLGKIQFMQDEVFSAGAKFNRALDIYPQYIAPRLFNFTMLSDQENYQELLAEIDKALKISDLWLYHFRKAKSLFDLKRYNQAIAEITDHCIKLNAYNLEEFFLLGDSYSAIKKYDFAKEAFERTQEIDIYKSEELYNNKMIELQELNN